MDDCLDDKKMMDIVISGYGPIEDTWKYAAHIKVCDKCFQRNRKILDVMKSYRKGGETNGT